MALGVEDDPRMATDAEMLSIVRDHTVTLRLRLAEGEQHEPHKWDWPTLLDLGPCESVVVTSHEKGDEAYFVDEEGNKV
jgi:hypothetical protein